MNFSFDHSMGVPRLKYQFEAGQELDSLTWDSIQYTQGLASILVPMELQQEASGMVLYYSISGLMNLLAWLDGATDAERKQIERRRQQAIMDARQYMILENQLAMEDRFTYVDTMTGDIRLICVPIAESGQDYYPGQQDAGMYANQQPYNYNNFGMNMGGQQNYGYRKQAILTRVSTQEEFVLDKAVNRIGKQASKTDVYLRGNSTISRLHCEISCIGGDYYLEDKDSSNYTYLNGKQLDAFVSVLLPQTCEIQLSDEKFLFRIQ